MCNTQTLGTFSNECYLCDTPIGHGNESHRNLAWRQQQNDKLHFDITIERPMQICNSLSGSAFAQCQLLSRGTSLSWNSNLFVFVGGGNANVSAKMSKKLCSLIYKTNDTRRQPLTFVVERMHIWKNEARQYAIEIEAHLHIVEKRKLCAKHCE